MIELTNLCKSYWHNGIATTALDNIHLSVESGQIFGVIGKSGAGKSTLIRCVNLLERPNQGKIIVNGHDLLHLSVAQLRQCRSEIGMIFQHFNLLSASTVWENIEFPLKLAKIPKPQRLRRIEQLLELTGLSEQRHQYPGQLSGGQKQRVAIARALAPEPKVLLCDEATSALDPKTTHSILQLLKMINKEFKITILLITHEMTVIKTLCDRVALLDHGKILEESDVFNFYTHPQTPLGHELTRMSLQTPLPDIVQEQLQPQKRADNDHSLLRIFFYGKAASQPLIAYLVRNFSLELNILQANIEFIKEQPIGVMYVAVAGSEDNLPNAIQYLENENVKVEVIGYVRGDVHIIA